MDLHQIRSNDGTGSLAYLLTAGRGGEAVLIDPNLTDVDRIEALVGGAGLRVTHIVDTHTHADHRSGAGVLRERLGAQVVMHADTLHKWKVVDQGDRFGIGDILRFNAAIPVDRYVSHGDVMETGGLRLTFLHTPGHTDNHLSVLAHGCLFTGDLLLIGQAGRSDLPGGNTDSQYDTFVGTVLPLPDETKIYPGHDYEDRSFSTLGEEKRSNPFLQPRTRDAYRAFVAEFFPPFAESAGENGAMTLQCGTRRVAQAEDRAIATIGGKELADMLAGENPPLVLDVREPVELMMTGGIEGAVNIPLGQLPERLAELPPYPDTRVACICASGSRSFEAAHYLRGKGYRTVYNVEGGVAGWSRAGGRLVRPRAMKREEI